MGLGASGRLYVGVNLEFARLPINNSVHAEQFLVVNALHHGEQAIQKMAVSAAPCGHCRQFYSELCCAVRSSPPLPNDLRSCASYMKQMCRACQTTCAGALASLLVDYKMKDSEWHVHVTVVLLCHVPITHHAMCHHASCHVPIMHQTMCHHPSYHVLIMLARQSPQQ